MCTTSHLYTGRAKNKCILCHSALLILNIQSPMRILQNTKGMQDKNTQKYLKFISVNLLEMKLKTNQHTSF